MGFSNTAQMQSQTASMLTPEGHAGFATFQFFMYAAFLFFLPSRAARWERGCWAARALLNSDPLQTDFIQFSTTCPQAQTLLSCIR